MAPSSPRNPSEGATDQGGNTAREPRTNLLLAATIEADDLESPVRIRNLSTAGAMIEGAALPTIGASLILRRRDLQIGAIVVWQQPGRCGISFNGALSVPEWVSGVRSAAVASSPAQLRVDAIQSAIRRGVPLPHDDLTPVNLQSEPDDLDHRVAQEMGYVRRLLDEVADELSGDPILLQRHARLLQNFDVACQILDVVQKVVGSSDRAGAIEAIKMGDVRARLTRKRLF